MKMTSRVGHTRCYKSYPRPLANPELNTIASGVSPNYFFQGVDIAPFICQPARQLDPQEMYLHCKPFELSMLRPEFESKEFDDENDDHVRWDYGTFCLIRLLVLMLICARRHVHAQISLLLRRKRQHVRSSDAARQQQQRSPLLPARGRKAQKCAGDSGSARGSRLHPGTQSHHAKTHDVLPTAGAARFGFCHPIEWCASSATISFVA